ncbi:MAG: sulfatase [Saprospiraceae bacterium]
MRHFHLSCYLIFSLFLTSCAGEVAPSTEVSQPNIVFILADDLGYSDVGFMGSKYYETPHLDELAARSMIFTNGYAACQVCSPSRASIMLGQFTARHGITDWIGAKTGTAWREKNRHSQLLPPDYQHQLPVQSQTLPAAFKAAGYTTFFAGKWHLGQEGNHPENHGFDINIGGWDKGSPMGGFFSPFENPYLEDRVAGENLPLRLAQETADFIKNSTQKPFLAYLSFYAVHGPIQTTKEKWTKYRDKAEQMGIAEEGFTAGDLLPMRKYQDNPVYAGLVESMDDAVGLVLNTLKATGLDKNTIVIFTSDNGGVTSGDNYSTNCSPLKGGKGYQWEGGIRIPYTISVPWLDLRGQKNATPVIGSDFFPTLLELAGLPLQPNAHLDGESIAPVLTGKKLAERPLYWHYPHYGNQGGRPVSIIRQGDWKLIYFWEDGHNELYHLTNDLQEATDLANVHPERTQQLAQQLLSWLKSVDANLPEPDPNYDAAKERAYVTATKIRLKELNELQRNNMLQKDWQPNENWWGSSPTID